MDAATKRRLFCLSGIRAEPSRNYLVEVSPHRELAWPVHKRLPRRQTVAPPRSWHERKFATILLCTMLRSWMPHRPRPDIGSYAKRKRKGERTRWALLWPGATWASAGLACADGRIRRRPAEIMGQLLYRQLPDRPFSAYVCNPPESHLTEDAAQVPQLPCPCGSRRSTICRWGRPTSSALELTSRRAWLPGHCVQWHAN